MSPRHVSIDERRARLARRHALAVGERLDDPVEIADRVVGLHGSDPATVYLSALTRLRRPSLAAVEAALYDRGDAGLQRILGMRRTVFAVPPELAAIVAAGATRAVAARLRRALVKDVEAGGIADDGDAWLTAMGDAVVQALTGAGPRAGTQVAKAVPALQARFHLSPGKPYEAWPAATSRVLTLLGAEGRIARGRPRGGWISGQFTWTVAPPALALDTAAAQVELARRYLRAYGPATVADVHWWTGWTLGETRRALAALDLAEVDLGGATGVLLADDDEPVAPPEQWVALLPGLDPAPMGWKERDWYLGPHRPVVFDYSGNIGPTLWCDGRVVGGWVQRADGTIARRLLEDVGAEATAAIEAAAGALEALLRPVVVKPRFPAPLDRELAGR